MHYNFFYYKTTVNVTFWLIENSAHDNFFYKITIGKLTKFAIFGMFCNTEHQIAMFYKISTALKTFRILVRSSLDFAKHNCDWLK